MPDLNPLSPNRSRDRDPHEIANDDAAPAAKADAKKAAPAKAPAKAASHDALPEHAPSTKTMDKRAFTNPALAGSPKASKQPITVRDLCVAASRLGAKGPDGQISAEELASCVKTDGACLSPEDARKVANACTSLAQMDKSAAEEAAAAKNPMMIPTPAGLVSQDAIEARARKATTEQMLTQDSVRSNPLAALGFDVAYATGASRDQAYNVTVLADEVTIMASNLPVAGRASTAAVGHLEEQQRQAAAMMEEGHRKPHQPL